jgi:hypothetical protein
MHYGTNLTLKSRLCLVCERYCCQHFTHSGIAPELLETKQILFVDLAAQPVHLWKTVKVSHGANKPRRQKKAAAAVAQKAATVQTKQGRAAPPPSNHTYSPPLAGTNHWDIPITMPCYASRPVQLHASASAGSPLLGLRQNPLDKKQAVHVYPEMCSLGRLCFVWNCKNQICFVYYAVTTKIHNVNATSVRSLAVLTCECSETCIMAMHVVSQDDLISIAQFDLDQHQNINSSQTECNSLLSLCPYIKQHLHINNDDEYHGSDSAKY